ncbi:MAG: flagellar basal-body rod protein FlgG [Methylococcaceae bacterium]|nr:flagellar basal-body rod protein FlgG [Methylococcaceae bacterium]
MTTPSLWIAKTGLDAQQTQMSVISHNLANVNTTGFKKERAMFDDLLYQNVRQVGAQSTQNTTLPSGLQLGTGVRTVATEKIHTQGNLIQTGNQLDVAINGRGYFQVLLPNGDVAYTRDGSFKLDAGGQIVNNSGYTIDPAITVPTGAQSVTIGTDGTVSVLQAGTTAPVQVGNIQIADFINPTGLEPIGENLYRESVASGAPIVGQPATDAFGKTLQGNLEVSNVNVVEELVNMIETQRAYEMNSKAIQTTNDMLGFASNTL